MSALVLIPDLSRPLRRFRNMPNAEVALFIDQRVAAGISNLVSTAALSTFRSKLAKEAAVISPHPLFEKTTFIVKPEDV
jgi:hypothetical protein